MVLLVSSPIWTVEVLLLQILLPGRTLQSAVLHAPLCRPRQEDDGKACSRRHSHRQAGSPSPGPSPYWKTQKRGPRPAREATRLLEESRGGRSEVVPCQIAGRWQRVRGHRKPWGGSGGLTRRHDASRSGDWPYFPQPNSRGSNLSAANPRTPTVSILRFSGHFGKAPEKEAGNDRCGWHQHENIEPPLHTFALKQIHLSSSHEVMLLSSCTDPVACQANRSS